MTPTSKNGKQELGKKEKVNRKLEYWHRDELALRWVNIVHTCRLFYIKIKKMDGGWQ
jgi:hypothetical protein